MSGVGNANLIVLHWDEAGNKISPEEHRKRYPKRKRLWSAWGHFCTIKTEFSGINHNPDADGQPWIYVTYVMRNSVSLTGNLWTSSSVDAHVMHQAMCRKVDRGWFFWWRFRLWSVSMLTRTVKAVTPRG